MHEAASARHPPALRAQAHAARVVCVCCICVCVAVGLSTALRVGSVRGCGCGCGVASGEQICLLMMGAAMEMMALLLVSPLAAFLLGLLPPAPYTPFSPARPPDFPACCLLPL